MVFQKRWCFSIFLPFLILACGGGGGGGGGVSAQAVGTTIGEMNVGSVAEIPFGSGETAEVSFTDLTGQEQFVVSFYSLSNTAGGSHTTSLESALSLQGLSSGNLQDFSLTHHEPFFEEDPTSQFHKLLREAEVSLPPPSEVDSVSRSITTVTRDITVGDDYSVKVLNSLTSTTDYTTITAEVRYLTSHFIALRDTDASGVLSDSQIRQLMDDMEAVADEEYADFGDLSDTDNNDKVFVVFSPVLNGLGGSSGIVTGYFFGGDQTNIASSNHGEYLYCHVPDPSATWGVAISTSFYMSNTGPLCMPHELQHAINYHMKGGSTDPGWSNEGQSHLAEDIYNDFETVTLENPSRVDLCLGSSLASFIGGTGLAQRGCSYLFYRYLYEQADLGRFSGVSSGKTLIRSLHESAETGLASIEEVTGEEAESIAADFFVAVYLSGLGLSSESRYGFSGIDLRGAQDDNRGTVLDGPTVTNISSFPTSSSVSSMSSNYFLVTGADLLSSGSQLTLSGSDSMSPGAYLIRIEDD